MKKILTLVALVAVASIAFALPFQTLPYAAVNSTTAITTTNIYQAPIQAPVVYVTTGGMTNVDRAAIISDHSYDGVTWVIDSTNYCSATNAGTYAISPNSVNVNIYYRTRVTTTANVTVGVINAN